MSELIKRAATDTTFAFRVAEEKDGQVTFEVTPEGYARDQAAGLAKDETLKPGRNTGARGGFQKRHPNFRPGVDNALANCKVKVTMYLDADVLEHFKSRAAGPQAAPYQTQINAELRAIMERERAAQPEDAYRILLEDEQFLAALAAKLQAFKPKRRRKVA
jgi:uncharacterized protein (DUF4415 family)